MRLNGRVAVVTGGTGGLGKAVSTALMREGAHVVCAARTGRPARAARPGGGDGPEAEFRTVDVRDAESVSSLMTYVGDHYGRLDILVANAGISRPGPMPELSTTHWEDMLATNLTGTLHCVQAAVPHLRKSGSGRIITLSSVLGTRPTEGAGGYCATKAAVEMLTRVCALELAPSRITVNCLAPGFIDEGMGQQLVRNEAVWSRYRPKLAGGQLGQGADVAHAAVFLASDDSAYVNGHVLEVSGGLRW